MAVQRGIRGLAKFNKEVLDDLAAYANTLPPIHPTTGKLAGHEVPVRLSKARILDIILWSDVAIHDENHQLWSRWYAEEVDAGATGARIIDTAGGWRQIST